MGDLRAVLDTWLQRRGVYPVVAITLALAVLGHAVTALIPTPQFSGADAPLSIRTGLAALGGASFAALVRPGDALAEKRSVRHVRVGRRLGAGVVLALGTAAFAITIPLAWDWPAARTYVFLGAALALVARSGGAISAAVAFAGYIGACFFVGMPLNGPAHWWAIPLHTQPWPTTATSLLGAAALAALGVAFASAPLPSDHKRNRSTLMRATGRLR